MCDSYGALESVLVSVRTIVAPGDFAGTPAPTLVFVSPGSGVSALWSPCPLGPPRPPRPWSACTAVALNDASTRTTCSVPSDVLMCAWYGVPYGPPASVSSTVAPGTFSSAAALTFAAASLDSGWRSRAGRCVCDELGAVVLPLVVVLSRALASADPPSANAARAATVTADLRSVVVSMAAACATGLRAGREQPGSRLSARQARVRTWRSARRDPLGEARDQGDRLVAVDLVEDLMAGAVDHVQVAIRAREPLDDGARELDRHELVVAAMDVEQRQVPEPGAGGDRLVRGDERLEGRPLPAAVVDERVGRVRLPDRRVAGQRRDVDRVRGWLGRGEPALHHRAEPDGRAAEDEAGELVAMALHVARRDEPAHRMADHDDRKVAARLAHDRTDVVDDRLEVLDERRLALRPAVSGVVGPDHRRPARDQRLRHMLVPADVLAVAVHQHDEARRIGRVPPAHPHAADRGHGPTVARSGVRIQGELPRMRSQPRLARWSNQISSRWSSRSSSRSMRCMTSLEIVPSLRSATTAARCASSTSRIVRW